MTPEQARIVLLEDALIQSHHTIEFLHECLTSDGFSYDYPEQTVSRMAAIKALVDIPKGCHHSKHSFDCDECRARMLRRNLSYLAGCVSKSAASEQALQEAGK